MLEPLAYNILLAFFRKKLYSLFTHDDCKNELAQSKCINNIRQQFVMKIQILVIFFDVFARKQWVAWSAVMWKKETLKALEGSSGRNYDYCGIEIMIFLKWGLSPFIVFFSHQHAHTHSQRVVLENVVNTTVSFFHRCF